MLIYHQAFDIYHTALRIIRILSETSNGSMEKDKLRIIDFLVLFPHDLANVKMPVGSTQYRSKFKTTKYNSIPNRKRIFSQVGKFFETSLQCLLSYGLIDLESFKHNVIKLIQNETSDSVREISLEITSIDPAILEFSRTFLFEMSLHELKKRTDLIEYRYDILES